MFEEIVRGERKAGILFFPLWLISMVYCAVVKFRNYLYDNGIIKVEQALLPVISIGNVTVGGSGKTPVTSLLISKLQKLYPSIKIAIVTRGYRSAAERSKEPVLVKKGDKATEVGDEPLELFNSHGNVDVWICSNRLNGCTAAKNLGADLVLLDDGMQHRKLYRDLEIVCVTDAEERGEYLPLGPLRDDLKRLESADLIVGSRGDLIIKREFKNAEVIRGKKVALFCGLGNPQQFVEMVKNLSSEIVLTKLLSDHEPLGNPDKFLQEAKRSGAELVICTQKDAIKIEGLDPSIVVMELQLTIQADNGKLGALLEKLPLR